MMMKYAVAALTIAGTLTLAGCSGQGSASSATQAGGNADTGTTSAPSSTQVSTSTNASASADIKAGVAKMLVITADIKVQLAAGNDTKIKTDGGQLEEEWSQFEDSAKAKSPDLYASVEKYLDPEVAASKASPIDKQTVAKLNDQLTLALTQLADSAK